MSCNDGPSALPSRFPPVLPMAIGNPKTSPQPTISTACLLVEKGAGSRDGKTGAAVAARVGRCDKKGENSKR